MTNSILDQFSLPVSYMEGDELKSCFICESLTDIRLTAPTPNIGETKKVPLCYNCCIELDRED